MTKKVDLDKYLNFVDGVTSDSSKDFVDLADRLGELDRQGANIERLTTAGVGLAAESGEFLEIVKKMVFQGNLGMTTIESILLLSWVMLCGMWHKLVWLWTSVSMR